MLQIGNYQLANNLLLAPMAGVTDRPFRILCRRFGAGLAVTEMIASAPHLRHSKKSQLRLNHTDEDAPRSVQIVGADPLQLADAARYNVGQGAQVIDINMGCPAKKVCNVLSGSALLKDEKLVASILQAVVAAVDVPVTLKIRTGWSPDERNAVHIAKIAEDSGVQLLTIHGRTRACAYKGDAEYDTIAQVKQNSTIPIIANGDIDSGQKAKFVLDYTQADGIMIGRAAQGKPWIFQQISHYLQHNTHLPEPTLAIQQQSLLEHLKQLYDFYGKFNAVRIARKHIAWYCKAHPDSMALWRKIQNIDVAEQQYTMLQTYFMALEYRSRTPS